MSGEITCKPSRGHSYSATVDEPKLVPQTTHTAGGGIHCYSPQERDSTIRQISTGHGTE